MNVLVIGSGGREHALVWKLAQSPRVHALWCAPGNAGIPLEKCAANGSSAQCAPVGAEDLPALSLFARENKINLTVVGPDNSLARGIVDHFQREGLRIWGPNQNAARFESSKVFAQEFMERHGIPTARAGSFSEPQAAREFAMSLGGRCAVKADGLALGKGVVLCAGPEDAERAIGEIMVESKFGSAGRQVVIQEFLEGMEISTHAICDGKTALLFPTSQDHKRLGDHDTGPNTGGMGAYSPTPFVTRAQLEEIEQKILAPWLSGCAAEGIDFRGILYPGIMLTATGPKVLEFNARFGDPETQVYLPRLENDLIDVLEASLAGELDKLRLRWKPQATVCVVMASAGYPGQIASGKEIHGLDEVARMENVKVFHAGAARKGDRTVTSGGRVLGVTAWDTDLRQARERAYRAVAKIEFEGAQVRRDIGNKALGDNGPLQEGG
jgi:phosphoribosylamine--glycine ligase